MIQTLPYIVFCEHFSVKLAPTNQHQKEKFSQYELGKSKESKLFSNEVFFINQKSDKMLRLGCALNKTRRLSPKLLETKRQEN